jgi:hypothetical protein
MLTAFWKPLR